MVVVAFKNGDERFVEEVSRIAGRDGYLAKYADIHLKDYYRRRDPQTQPGKEPIPHDPPPQP
jgi:hypothetical protein